MYKIPPGVRLAATHSVVRWGHPPVTFSAVGLLAKHPLLKDLVATSSAEGLLVATSSAEGLGGDILC